MRIVPSATPKRMLTVRREGAQTVVEVNSSSLSLLQTCDRKSYYTLHEGWRGRNGSPPQIHGLGIHKAMEVFYTHPGKERELPVNFEEHAQLIGQGYAAPEKHFLYDAVQAYATEVAPLQSLPADDPRSLTSGIWVLCHYFQTYINDEYVIHSDDKGPIVERSFETVLHDTEKLKIILFGTIDFALRNQITGEVLVGDHKTTSRLGGEFMNRIKPNHQYTGYLLGAHRTLGTSSEHFLVNGIEVKAKPKTARGGPPKFIRQITRRDQQDFVEFTHAVVGAVERYLHNCDVGTWPLGNVDACAMWGGCPYLKVCSAPNALRQNILEAEFVRSTQC